MNQDEVLYLLQQGGNPLELSIAKWADIVNNVGTDQKCDNCALCLVTHDCTNCVIAEGHHARRHCHITPYVAWITHQQREHAITDSMRVKCADCRALALAELDFLKSLRDQYVGGHAETYRRCERVH